MSADNWLLYEVMVADLLSTSDESVIDLECTGLYSREWEDKMMAMVEDVNDAIDDGLCEDDSATTITYIYSFASLGTQVGVLCRTLSIFKDIMLPKDCHNYHN
jgi:hypothetical protein